MDEPSSNGDNDNDSDRGRGQLLIRRMAMSTIEALAHGQTPHPSCRHCFCVDPSNLHSFIHYVYLMSSEWGGGDGDRPCGQNFKYFVMRWYSERVISVDDVQRAISVESFVESQCFEGKRKTTRTIPFAFRFHQTTFCCCI